MKIQSSIISEANFSTVVAEYTPLPKSETHYQSEAELEADLLKRLTMLGYERIGNPNYSVLVNNLRRQLSHLNKTVLGEGGLSDKEWEWLWTNVLAHSNDGVKEKTKRLQVDNRYTITRDNGEQVNIMLVDKTNIFSNNLQVFNQYREDGTKRTGIYDVTILVNGLPMVHIELKRRGVPIKEAFNQIARYSRDNFYGSSGLFDWVQVFVISNGAETKYYSNTTRQLSQKENESTQANTRRRKTSHSFEFTSYWADALNRNILDLVDFAETFCSKGSLLNILTKYCVFTNDEMLLVMRPYQIVASEAIISKITNAQQYRKKGTIDAGGYVWHTTGSGKTLTSFKTAQLATNLDFVDKVIFVVDRKDLDYQTIKEFEKFGGRDAVSGNVSTEILNRQLANDNSRVIVTTIQKLNKFVDKHKVHPIFGKNCVLIFDECHRSQFGAMHKSITNTFVNYFLFGFTGTPIFDENAASGTNGKIFKNKKGQVELVKTTDRIFGRRLHAYTIVDAISDGNVLPFRVDLVDTIKYNDNGQDVQVINIDRESAIRSRARIAAIVEYILDNFNTKTYRHDGAMYDHSVIANTVQLAKSKTNTAIEQRAKRKTKGFNSMLAVDSIESAKLYYKEFGKQQQERGGDLRVATIFSYSPNEDINDYLEEEFETDMLDQSSRDFLDEAIKDYNSQFGTNWDTSSDKFASFYKDVSMRVKNKEIDILIVVNMFLTGFDATTLNTLWLDKNLKYHGLIQAFSRTNRILNSQKRYGNIVTFRQMETQINQACSLFGNKDAKSVVVIRPFKDYYEGYEDKPGYKQLVEMMQTEFELPLSILGESKQREFVRIFGAFLRVENILRPFDEFVGKEILTPRQRQEYQGAYLSIHEVLRKDRDGEAVKIEDDLIFEIELIKQLTVNIDYILIMVDKYKNAVGSEAQELALADIVSAVDSRPELRSKKELILGFVATVNTATDVVAEWHSYVKQERDKVIDDLITTENLNEQEATKFLERCLLEGEVKETGTDIDNVLPPMSMFEQPNKRAQKKKNVLARFRAFVERFLF
ncbi:MAG: type I restriction endonuclease subunit R [Clostridiales bacterium]|jgi:type I restriction enzyme R subunit|nr:type I restriction endonuclease subunit R [Clostridiales bacterium]